MKRATRRDGMNLELENINYSPPKRAHRNYFWSENLQLNIFIFKKLQRRNIRRKIWSMDPFRRKKLKSPEFSGWNGNSVEIICKEARWDQISRDETRWVETRRDELRRDEMSWDETRWVETRWVETRWVETRWVETRWIETRWIETI